MTIANGIFVAAKIFDRSTGETVDLWTPEHPFVTGITVEMGLGLNPRITVSLEAPYREGLKLMNRTLLNISNVLMVRMGYTASGWMTPWYAGLLKNPGVAIDSNGFSASLEAEGAGALAMIRTSGRQYTGTIESVVREIAEKFGWGVVVQASDQGNARDGLEREIDVAQAGDSFWMCLRKILYDVGFDFWIGVAGKEAENQGVQLGQTALYLVRRAAWTSSQPARKFVMFGSVDRSTNQYPLLAFSCDSMESWSFAGSAGFKTAFMDEDGEIVVLDAKEGDTETTHLGDGSIATGVDPEVHAETGTAMDVELEEGDAGEYVASLPAGGEQEALDARRDQVFALSGIEADIDSIGVPVMVPGEVVEVHGVSKRFDGPYGVYTVRHTAGAGGFDTSWHGKRNAFSKDMAAGAVAGAVNRQPSREDDEAEAAV